MNSIIKYLIFMLIVQGHFAHWILEWNEEFESQNIDTNKWIVENQKYTCTAHLYFDEIQCNTNSTKNIRTIDGSLAITPVRENYLDREFTSGHIWTKRTFSFGKIDIRAAMPKGKLLFAIFMLWPERRDDSIFSITISQYSQTKVLTSSVNFNNKFNDSYVPLFTDSNLNDFHLYSIEWNETQIVWKFDSKTIHFYDFNNQYFDEVIDFTLYISLGVGGSLFPKEFLTLDSNYNWVCPSLFIDYVRYYRWDENQTQKASHTEDKSHSRSQLCKALRGRDPEDSTSNVYLITIIVLLVLVLILISSGLTFFFIRQKKLRQNNESGNPEVYDDNQCENYYQTINMNDYEINHNSVHIKNTYLEIHPSK